MKPHQVLGQYLEVYGQLSPITPEARKKKAPFSNIANFLAILGKNSLLTKKEPFFS